MECKISIETRVQEFNGWVPKSTTLHSYIDTSYTHTHTHFIHTCTIYRQGVVVAWDPFSELCFEPCCLRMPGHRSQVSRVRVGVGWGWCLSPFSVPIPASASIWRGFLGRASELHLLLQNLQGGLDHPFLILKCFLGVADEVRWGLALQCWKEVP